MNKNKGGRFMYSINKKQISRIVKCSLLFVGILCCSMLCAGNNEVVYFDIRELKCDEMNCYFPDLVRGVQNIHIKNQFDWDEDKNLILHTNGNIVFENTAKIVSKKGGAIILKAGINPTKKIHYDSTVIFNGDSIQIETIGNGKIIVHYNPSIGQKSHKYHNPSHYFYSQHIKAGVGNVNLHTYMLVNDVQDLSDVRAFLSANYALSKDINASETLNWNRGQGFNPITDDTKEMPFSGNFDGNGYVISDLFINRPNKKYVGLFGKIRGRNNNRNTIENLALENFNIRGDYYVGSLAGSVINSNISNIKVINPNIKSTDIAGGVIGTTVYAKIEPVEVTGNILVSAEENKGFIIGGGEETSIGFFYRGEQPLRNILGQYKFLGNTGDNTTVCTINFKTEGEMQDVLKRYKFLNNQGNSVEMCSSFYKVKANSDVISQLLKDKQYMICILSFIDFLCGSEKQGGRSE